MLPAYEGVSITVTACRYRSLAGHSLRALRLDLELAVLHYLQDLPSNKWACEEEEATEVPASLVLWSSSSIMMPEQILPATCSLSSARQKDRHVNLHHCMIESESQHLSCGTSFDRIGVPQEESLVASKGWGSAAGG